MRLLIGGRRSGKTTKLVEWLLRSDDHFILSAFGRKHYESVMLEVIERKYADLTPEQRAGKADRALARVHSARQGAIPPGLGHSRRQEWMVDDLDGLLASLVGGNVVGATHGPDIVVQSVQDA